MKIVVSLFVAMSWPPTFWCSGNTVTRETIKGKHEIIVNILQLIRGRGIISTHPLFKLNAT